MAREAKENAAADQKRRDSVEARNKADGMIYSVEKTLKDHRDKVSEAEAKTVEAALEEAKKAVQEGDAAKINFENFDEELKQKIGSQTSDRVSELLQSYTFGSDKPMSVFNLNYFEVSEPPL